MPISEHSSSFSFSKKKSYFGCGLGVYRSITFFSSFLFPLLLHGIIWKFRLFCKLWHSRPIFTQFILTWFYDHNLESLYQFPEIVFYYIPLKPQILSIRLHMLVVIFNCVDFSVTLIKFTSDFAVSFFFFVLSKVS